MLVVVAMKWRHLTRYVLQSGLVAVVLTACGKDSPAAGDPPTASSGPGSPQPPRENTVVLADGRNWGEDRYVVNSAAIDGDRLTISVSYGGGCRNHVFTLVISKSFMESDPVQLQAVLAHNANGDPCEAYPTESISFDLGLVKARYQQFYGPGPGQVVLRIRGCREKISFTSSPGRYLITTRICLCTVSSPYMAFHEGMMIGTNNLFAKYGKPVIVPAEVC